MSNAIRFAAAALLLLLLDGVSGVRAQIPQQRELRETPQGIVLDFRSDGVWRRRVREIATLRAQLRGGAPPGQAPVAQGVFVPSVSGILRVPAIFFRYQDQGTGTVHAIADLEARLFGAAPPAGLPYTIRTFYDEMSGGVFRIEGQAIGWLTLDNNEESYTGTPGTCIGNPFGTTNCNGIFSNAAINALHTGLAEAIGKADASVDFGNFDNDGPDGLPNSGDDDGVVDLMAFYHSELDGSCGGASNNHIWAHRFAMSPVATNDARTGGGVITVRDYVVQGGVGGPAGCTQSQPVAIGTSTHEFGHGLGLPDLYDTGGNTEGVGQWDLMGSGNWSTQPSPARMSAFSLNEMGWINVVDVTAATSLVLPPVTTSRTAHAIRVQDPNPRGEFFLIENRQGLLSDSAMIRTHCGVSGLSFPATCAGGLAVWHVDSVKIAGSLNSNTVNSGAIHGVALVQADGDGDLENGLNRGDAGDVWPGTTGATTFDAGSSPPATKNHDGSWVGFELNAVTQLAPNGNVSVDVVFATPITLAVSPQSFEVSAPEGTTTPIPASANVVLSGTGADAVAWTASANGAAWITATTFAGTGSGQVEWSRDPTGLGAGTHIATITVTADGAIGSPGTIIDTLIVLPPLVMSVTPDSRADTVVQGAVTPLPDSAAVNFSGTGAALAQWNAVHGSGSWLTVTTSGGTGSGTVRWNRDPSGLAAGVYVDTVTVSASGAAGSPAMVVDTLVVLPPLVMTVSPESRLDSAVVGATASRADSATVTFSGTGAGAAAWSASSNAPWIAITQGAGTGDGQVTWSRDPTNLTTGVYVDTIVVTSAAQGSPAQVIDSLVMLAPLAMTVTPAGATTTVVLGAAAVDDSAVVAFTGTGAAGAPWTATHGAGTWLTLTTSSGISDGRVRWRRDPTGLAIGTYIDTITVTGFGALGSPATLVDTLHVVQPLTLAVSPSSVVDSVPRGATNAPSGAATVTLSGAGSAQASWSAAHGGSGWLSLNQTSGVGTGPVTWTRNPAGLVEGIYVDTIVVTAAGAVGSPASIVDSLVVLPPPDPLVLTVQPTSRSVEMEVGDAPTADSVNVNLSGTGSATAPWTATHGDAPWVTLSGGAGTGSGWVRWERDPTGLAPGTYVAVITVTAAGADGSPSVVTDTLVVRTPVVPISLTVDPAGMRMTAVSGQGVSALDSARVVVVGTGSESTVWLASSRAPWFTFNRLSGTGTGYMRWTRDASVLTPGVYVDTVTVVADQATTQFLDTLEVTPPTIPADEAVRELLEGGVLPGVYTRYLDSLGNRDGRFNLGDVLAHLDRLGATVPPALRHDRPEPPRDRPRRPTGGNR